MLKRLGLIAVLGLICYLPALAQIDEYQMKAVFLYNFAKFVEWPEKPFLAPSDPLVICILGSDPFTGHLVAAVHGKAIKGRPLAIRLVSGLPAPSECQILFVNSSDRQRFRSMAGRLKGEGILTVGEASWFIGEGGIINFKLEDGNVRFEISTQAAEQAQVSISSRLLTLGQVRK